MDSSVSFVTGKGKAVFKYHLAGKLDKWMETIETLLAMIEERKQQYLAKMRKGEKVI